MVVVLPHTLEVHQLGRELAGAGATASRTKLLQSLPFPHALCAADGGDILYFASCDAVYALLPPAPSPAAAFGSFSTSWPERSKTPPPTPKPSGKFG